MTQELAKNTKDTERIALSTAKRIDSINGLSNELLKLGGRCYAVVDGSLKKGKILDAWKARSIGDAEFSRMISFSGVSLKRLVEEGRVKITAVPM